jgi:ABC-2 type transport system permease protein
MLRSITTENIFNKWKSISLWSISMFLLSLLLVSIYESVAVQLFQSLEDIPDELEVIWGTPLPVGGISSEEWLGLELFGFIYPLCLCIIGINLGAAAIGNEEASGTLELLLSSPISRRNILFQKTIAIYVQLFVVAISVFLGICFGKLFFSFEVALSKVFFASFSGFLLGILISHISLLSQSCSGKKAYGLAIGSISVGSFWTINAIASLIETLDSMKFLSAFYYYNGAQVLNEGIEIKTIVAFSTCSTIMYIITDYIFGKRDLGV